MTGSNEFKLNQPPEDGISSVKFSPNTSQFLLVSSWDTSVRLYDVPANSMRLKYQHTGAVLDCAFYVGARSGGLCVPGPALVGATLLGCWAGELFGQVPAYLRRARYWCVALGARRRRTLGPPLNVELQSPASSLDIGQMCLKFAATRSDVAALFQGRPGY